MTVLAFCLLAALPPAIAQGPAPSTGTGAAGAAASPAPPAASAGANRAAARDADARVCLEFASNLQVIACAEKYRRHRRKGWRRSDP
jgi:hypothetical protein